MELRVTVFVYIDDWLKPYQDILPRTDSSGQQPAQKASYSELLELLTIAVVGEILAQPKVGFAGYESTWYWIVNQLFRELFPKLPHYTRYHRILRNAERLLAKLALSVLTANRIHLVDSKPLPVANPKSPPLGLRWARRPVESVPPAGGPGFGRFRFGSGADGGCHRQPEHQDDRPEESVLRNPRTAGEGSNGKEAVCRWWLCGSETSGEVKEVGTLRSTRDRGQTQGKAGLYRAISSLGSRKDLCLARSLSASSEGLRAHSCEFVGLGETGCLPIHDATGSKVPTGWKDRLIPGMMTFRSSS